MANNLTKFTSIESYVSFIQSGATLPNVSKVMTSGGDYLVEYNPMEQGNYFWIFARGEGNIIVNIQAGNPVENLPWVDYSKDDGETWARINNEDNVAIEYNIPVNVGDTVIFKAEAVSGTCYNKGMNGKSNDQGYTSAATQSRMYFNSTCQIDCGGNIASLMYGDDFADKTETKTVDAYPFFALFNGCNNLISARNLCLSLGGNAWGLYQRMFQDCKKLVEGPKSLPIKTVKNNAYYSMFRGCASLTDTSVMQASSLGTYACRYMYSACTSLTGATQMTTPSIGYAACEGMFDGCSSLTDAPEIESTTISSYAFTAMFRNCTSLTGATDIKATNINVTGACRMMFIGCTALKSAATMHVTTMGVSGCASMYENCTALEVAKVPNCGAKQASYMAMYRNCTSLKDAPALPTTSLGGAGCYMNMFYGCSSLTGIPATLPATTLQNNCYDGMFRYCTALKDMPTLPATALKNVCYSYMFANCTSLTGVPETLAATSSAANSLQGMFYCCTALKRAPNIKITSLAANQCDYMFYGCTGITTPPVISAITALNKWSCRSMFQNCTSLTKTPDFTPTTANAGSGCTTMFYGCTNLVSANNVTLKARGVGFYSSMFAGCSSLKLTPVFQMADTATETQFAGMFNGCTSLQTMPIIPKTNFGDWECCNMFQNCTSLTATTQTITANTATGNATFLQTFHGCKSLVASPIAFNMDPTGLTGDRIYLQTFYECSSLTGVTSLPTPYALKDRTLFKTFRGCESLQNAPQMEFYGVGVSACCETFSGCTALKNTPTLSVSSITGSHAMSRMFCGCSELVTNNITLTAEQLYNNCYYVMFGDCVKMTSPSNMGGVALKLSGSSISWMYSGCRSITNTPTFSVSSMAGTYNANGMFNGCTSLTGINITLGVTALKDFCYSEMFKNCTSLTTAAGLTLPATTYAQYCYQYMFAGCTNLTTPPTELKNGTVSTTIKYVCYRMFQGCTSLTQSPILRIASTPAKCYAYVDMFSGCTSLNKITCYFTTLNANVCTGWAVGVPTVSTGQFIGKCGDKAANRGTGGIPTNWTYSTAP